MDWYNGYSPNERNAMGRAPSPPDARKPPCAMCGDPTPAKMQTHAEDYSMPYRWEAPAAYPVCLRCHSRLHARFDSPQRWRSFLQFLRRGWYAREVSSGDLARHARLGEAFEWRPLPHDPPMRTGDSAWWWESLTLDAASRHQVPAYRANR
jgi:hypothetical protein